jgi:hypothetical protein
MREEQGKQRATAKCAGRECALGQSPKAKRNKIGGIGPDYMLAISFPTSSSS